MNIASVAFTVENLSFTLCVNDTFCIELIIERYVEDVFNWKFAILHFVIGGIAVALASIIADKVGGKLGGIIATMPAVFLAAIIALALDHRGTQLVEMSMNLSTGAIVGILSCILTVFLTSLYIKHKRLSERCNIHSCLLVLLFPSQYSVLDIYSLENA